MVLVTSVDPILSLRIPPPPREPEAALPVKELLVKVREPLLSTPPPKRAVLPLTVVFLKVAALLAPLKMPPPSDVEELLPLMGAVGHG